MSTIIQNVQLKDFIERVLSNKPLKACELFDGETYRGTFIPHNPHDSVVADRIRIQSEYLGASSNSIYPLDLPEPILVSPLKTPEQITREKRIAALAKGREVKRANREAVKSV